MGVVVEDKERALNDLREYIESLERDPSMLINVLHRAQEIFGWLPPDVLEFVSEELDVPLSQVYGVVTFYNFFSTKPVGKHQIKVCLGTACYIKGGDRVMERFMEELGLEEEGQVTEDGMFSVHAVRCLGACSMAPVVLVGERDFYGKVTPDGVPGILRRYRR